MIVKIEWNSEVIMISRCFMACTNLCTVCNEYIDEYIPEQVLRVQTLPP